MKKTIIIPLFLCVLAPAIYSTAVVIRFKTRSLDDWVSTVNRPGYELLDARKIGSQYVAVFKAGPDSIAVTSCIKGGAYTPCSSLQVKSMNDESLVKEPSGHLLNRDWRMNVFILDLLGPCSAVDGTVWRIKPVPSGSRLQVAFNLPASQGKSERYQARLDW